MKGFKRFTHFLTIQKKIKKEKKMKKNIEKVMKVTLDMEYHIVGSGRSGQTNLTNFTANFGEAHVDSFPITIHTDTDRERAIERFNTLSSVDHPTFLKVYGLNSVLDGTAFVTITEAVPPSFKKWLLNIENPWEHSQIDGRLLGPGADIRAAMRQIGSGLMCLLDRGEYHGNLLKGLGIWEDGTVKLSKMTPFKTKLSEAEFEAGVKGDIASFKGLVKQIELVRPPSSTCGVEDFHLLGLLCDEAQALSGKDLVDRAFFIYNNAAFYELSENTTLVFKLWDYCGTNEATYRQLFDFTSGAWKMVDWNLDFQKAYFSDFQAVYDKNKKAYMEPDGVIRFHRNALVHFGEYLGGCHVQHTQEMLKEVLPNFPAKLFYLVATHVKASESDFGAEIVAYLQEAKNLSF